MVAQVALPADPQYLVHPAVLDACFQAAGVLLFDRQDMLLPVGIERAFLHRPLAGEVWCRATITSDGDDFALFDLGLYDAGGQATLEVKGLRVVATSSFRSGDAAGQGFLSFDHLDGGGGVPLPRSGRGRRPARGSCSRMARDSRRSSSGCSTSTGRR